MSRNNACWCQRLAVVVIVLSGWLPASGQNIRWSSPLGDDNQMKYLKIIGSDENDFYVLRSNQPFGRSRKGFKSRKYRLACFTQDMVMRWDKTLTAPSPDGRILDVQMVNGRLLTSAYIQKGAVYQLVLQYIRSTGEFDGTPVVAEEWNGGRLDDESRPDLLLSGDQSLMALAYRVSNKDYSRQQYRTILCDTSLNILVRKEITVEAGDRIFSPVDMALSDSGNIYLLGSLADADKKGRATGETRYVLYAWWRHGDSLTVREQQATGVWLTDAALAADNKNGTAVVAGFYSHSQAAATAGVFYFRAGNGNSGESLNMSSFSEDFLKKVRGSKTEEGKELVNYSIDRILLRRDGGAVLSAEAYSQWSRSYYDYYTQMLISHTYYNFGNILTLSVNTDGTMLWSEVLNKDHQSTDDEGYLSSYCAAVYKAKMYYIYNKYIETKTSVMLTSLSSQGEQNTMVLFNEMERIVAVPRAARQIEADILLLPAYKENKLCIARISL